MTNRDIAQYALEALKKAGADEAQCIVSQGKTDELNVDGGEFSLMRSLLNSSVSLKAIVNHRKGTVSLNRLDRESIDKAVSECIAAAESSVQDEAEAISSMPEKGQTEFVSGVLEPDMNGLFDRIQECMHTLKSQYPKVLMEQLISEYSHTNILYMNTNGVELSYTAGGYGFSTMFSAHEGEKASSFNGYGANLNSLEIPFLEVGQQKILLEESEKQLSAHPVEGKFTGTLVIPPACLGETLSTVIGNFMSDSVIIDKTSPWIEKLGEKVADASFTLRTIPSDDRIVCGERFTSEGYRSEDETLIDKGILKTFKLSAYGSRKTGYPRSLNSSWNLEVLPGESSLEDILSGIDKGLVLNRFSGGQPGTNGDFSGVAKNSFLIENGKVTDAVSETMVSGNLAELLLQIRGISKERLCDGATVLPWIAFDGVTISGK